MEQYCTFYVPVPKTTAVVGNSNVSGNRDNGEEGEEGGVQEHEQRDDLTDTNAVTVVVLTPILGTQAQSDNGDEDNLSKTTTMPYYHPAVVHIAFRYIASDIDVAADATADGGSKLNHARFMESNDIDSDEDNAQSEWTKAHLRVEVIPSPPSPPSLSPSSSSSPPPPSTTLPPTDPTSKIYRTSLSLLSLLHRYGWGALTDYRKRVAHDVLVPRDAYQDLYLTLRARHAGRFVGEGGVWAEKTDPRKHVFEVGSLSFSFSVLCYYGGFTNADWFY